MQFEGLIVFDAKNLAFYKFLLSSIIFKQVFSPQSYKWFFLKTYYYSCFFVTSSSHRLMKQAH